jgi:hypothetical protein
MAQAGEAMTRTGYVERLVVDLERESREGAERESELRAEIARLSVIVDRSGRGSLSDGMTALDRSTRELVAMEADRDRWVARVKELEARLSIARAALDGRP